MDRSSKYLKNLVGAPGFEPGQIVPKLGHVTAALVSGEFHFTERMYSRTDLFIASNY